MDTNNFGFAAFCRGLRRKVIMVVVLPAVILIAFGFAIWFDLFTPAAPAGWAQVHSGMIRDEVLHLAGPPSISGWPEKVVETWQREGVICHHRLVVAYDGDRAARVWDGTWLRGFGWLH